MTTSGLANLVCPKCFQAKFRKDLQRIVCDGCQHSAPNLNGVPLLVPQALLVDQTETLRRELALSHVDRSELMDVFLGASMFGYRHVSLSSEFSNLNGRFACLRDAVRENEPQLSRNPGFAEGPNGAEQSADCRVRASRIAV